MEIPKHVEEMLSPDELAQLNELSFWGKTLKFAREVRDLYDDLNPHEPDNMVSRGNWGGL